MQESANIIEILDGHFPSIRLFDPVIISLFEVFDAMHELSHNCLGRILRIGYKDSIRRYTEKVYAFLNFTTACGHLHSHIACTHLEQVLEFFDCGLSSIAPDQAIEVTIGISVI